MPKTRRSGIKIMYNLILLLDHLVYIMLLAITCGSLGFIAAMGVNVMGALGIAKVLGEDIALSYELIMILAFTFGIIRGILRYFEQYVNHYIAFSLLALLRDKLFKALRKLGVAKIDNEQKGNLMAMISSDIETLEVFYAHTISPIVIAIIVSSVVIFFLSYYISIYLALVALIAYLFLGIVLVLISSSRLKDIGVSYRNTFASFNAYFLDSIKGIKDIVLHNACDIRSKEVNERSNILIAENKKIRDESCKASALGELSVSLFIIIALLVGIYLVNIEIISLGKMIIAMITIFSSFAPVLAINALPSNLNQTFASGERVLNLLKEKPLVEDIKHQHNFSFNELKLEKVSFAYEKKLILKDINLKVKSGEIVGIVGDSGCGKSTLLKLLLRFYRKQDGLIAYNGIDIENINSTSLLDNVVMVSQSTYLFDDSIEANLRIAKVDASLAQIQEACMKASIHDFIMSLPDGYQSQVGMLGDNLSAGEKQRLGLARAFLSGRKLILLDEPTSNVDSINEGIILKALKKHKEDKAIILVSHRESTMAIADRIYHMKQGYIYE